MVRHGRLADPGEAPAAGERVSELVASPTATVAQILSGALDGPVDYDDPRDELAVVLAGAAVLDVGGERLALEAGDWVWLPAGRPHRLVETRPGTSWLTVHVTPGPVPGGGR